MISAPLFVAGLFAQVIAALAARIAPGAGQVAGIQVVQTLAVQLVLIAVLGAGVSGAVSFLKRSVAAMGDAPW